jgi:hypothetical protein
MHNDTRKALIEDSQLYPHEHFKVRYIAISGGKQTAEGVLGKDLTWFCDHARDVISWVYE